MAASHQVTAGIHLPQAGPAASGPAIQRAARLAEELGYADVWVSDHLAVPTDAPYPPSPWIYEPFITLTWAAAVTARVRLGTTVLVLPMRHPLITAKSVASIDRLSNGRMILGLAAGWLEAEFDALGVPFHERGARTDEGIAMLRRLWTDDHITAEFPVHSSKFASMRALPRPAGHIPIWVGGHAEVALARAVRVGEGWHGAFLTPEQTKWRVERLRRDRPEPGFPISMRTRWDALEDSADTILGELDDYVSVGVTHLVPEPRQRNADDYLRSIEALAALMARAGVAFTTS
jgi:probable F420-dependent oxidoreductase